MLTMLAFLSLGFLAGFWVGAVCVAVLAAAKEG